MGKREERKGREHWNKGKIGSMEEDRGREGGHTVVLLSTTTLIQKGKGEKIDVNVDTIKRSHHGILITFNNECGLAFVVDWVQSMNCLGKNYPAWK